MDDLCNKLMTQYDPKNVEALIEAAKQVTDFLNGRNLQSDMALNKKRNLEIAIAKLKPKPAKVYVLPEWEKFRLKYQYYGNEDVALIDNKDSSTIYKSTYEKLRELTATDTPAQKNYMPPWDELIKTTNNTGEVYGWIFNQIEYNAIRKKIMGL